MVKTALEPIPRGMKLVEIMPGQKTSMETLETVAGFARQLGKDPVVCKSEAPAGIVSRVLGQMLNEATWLVASGVAEPADVDKAMKLGANHPMGPLQLIDMIGQNGGYIASPAHATASSTAARYSGS